MENVKALTHKKFLPYLLEWERYLGSLGYTNFTKVLNAKNYGVPQNRERVFMVSILGDAWYEFPEPFALDKRLKDVLEKDVDEKYYLSYRCINRLSKNNNSEDFCVNENGVSRTLCSSMHKITTFDNYIKDPTSCAMRGRNPGNPSDRTAGIPTEQRIEVGGDVANCITSVQKDSMVVEPNIIQLGNIFSDRGNFSNPQRGRVYDKEGLSPSLLTMQGGNTQPKIIEDDLNESCMEIEWKGKTSHEGDGLYLATTEKFIRAGLRNVSRTLKANVHDAGCVQNYRIRKLTERECFRLMGVSDYDIDKIQKAGISRTQQYKLSGNSIVVDVLYYIFKNMFVK